MRLAAPRGDLSVPVTGLFAAPGEVSFVWGRATSGWATADKGRGGINVILIASTARLPQKKVILAIT